MALNYIGPVYAVQVPKNHEDEGHGAMRASMVFSERVWYKYSYPLLPFSVARSHFVAGRHRFDFDGPG